MVNLPTILRLLFCFKLLFYFYMDCVCLNLIHIFVTSINQENNCHEVVNTVFWMLWKFHSTQIFGTMKPRLSNIFDDIVHMFLETSNTTCNNLCTFLMIFTCTFLHAKPILSRTIKTESQLYKNVSY